MLCNCARVASTICSGHPSARAAVAIFSMTRSLFFSLLLAISMRQADGVVTDDKVVFVTSANLTEAAFDRNFELGLLVRDHALALSVSSHFRGLIDRGFLRRLP